MKLIKITFLFFDQPDMFEVEFVFGLVPSVSVRMSNDPNSEKKKFYPDDMVISEESALEYLKKFKSK